MNKKYKYRNIYKTKQALSNIFINYKFIIYTLMLIFILGLIIGTMVCSKRSSSLDIDNLFDIGFISFLKGKKSGISLFFNYIFFYGTFIFISIIFNSKFIFAIFNYFIVFINGYLFSFNLTAIIIHFGFAGIINSIFILIPINLIIYFLIMFIFSISIKKYLIIKKYGCICNYSYKGINYNKLYIILISLLIILIIVKCLFLPLLKITIIIK